MVGGFLLMSLALSREHRAACSGDGRVVGALAVARCRRRRGAFSRGFAPNRIGRMGLARTRQEGENVRQGTLRSPSGILKYGGSVNTRAGLASKPICNHVHGAARRDCSDAVSSTRSLSILRSLPASRNPCTFRSRASNWIVRAISSGAGVGPILDGASIP